MIDRRWEGETIQRSFALADSQGEQRQLAMCAMLFPGLILFGVWVLVFGEEIARWKLSVRSMLVATALVAIYMAIVRLAMHLSN